MASSPLAPPISDPGSFHREAMYQGACQVTGDVGPDWEAHHTIYKKHLRNKKAPEHDPRGALRVSTRAHGDHHSRKRVIRTVELLDCNIEHAINVFGPVGATSYLRRYYDDTTTPDPRLEALCPAI